MRIAITGGSGFVGGHLARHLTSWGHDVVLIARGWDERDAAIRNLPRSVWKPIGLDDVNALVEAFAGCDAIAHCAGINREIGAQTYEHVHVTGTANVVEAATRAGARRIALLSFLRARPACGSPYHESKWAAEQIVRTSGLDYTILKCGVIYGRGDHMLDHLSHAMYTFPLFALVGVRDRHVRPVAVEDVVRVLEASLIEGRLPGITVSVLGPEDLPLAEAVRRVARVIGRKPWMFPMPVAFHRFMASILERTMKIPLVSRAQVRILSEGVVEPLPFADPLPDDLRPRIPFSDAQIRSGLPEPGRFGLADCRWCHA